MQWLIAVLMALSFAFAGGAGMHAEMHASVEHAQPHGSHPQSSDPHCHTAGDMCCAHAISCCVVLNDVSSGMKTQAISHGNCIDASAQRLALPVPHPPPRTFPHSS